jgi:hypothetical protein
MREQNDACEKLRQDLRALPVEDLVKDAVLRPAVEGIGLCGKDNVGSEAKFKQALAELEAR